MPLPTSTPDAGAPPLARPAWARLPAWVLALALLMGLLHLAPFLRAAWTVGPGYEFTGNLSTSPDYMQYRVWERRSALTGPITDNPFTTEPHRPYLPVLFYWGLGLTGRILGCRPELAYAGVGAVLAVVFTLLVFWIARRFLEPPRAAHWTALAVLFGGGLGAHMRWAAQSGVAGPRITERLQASLAAAPAWESYRSHYPIKVLFDAHFLLVWVATLAALLAFHGAVERPTRGRLATTALLCALITLLHVYEGPLLLLVFGLLLVLCRLRKVEAPGAWRAALAGGAAVALTLVALRAIYVRGGLPHPTWTEVKTTPLKLLLAYPVAWALLAGGLRAYWRRARPGELFLLAWAAACVLMTLSGAIYPYSGRGPTTLQLPLLLIAGGIYFARRQHLAPQHFLLAAALMAWTPASELLHRWRQGGFDRNNPAAFLSVESRALVDALRAAAGTEDVLLAEVREYRWLAPEHPGRSYHAHFFLTVEHERKLAEVEGFYTRGEPGERARFLRERGIDFLHVGRWRGPDGFRAIPGLREIQSAHGGVLFAFEPGPDPQ